MPDGILTVCDRFHHKDWLLAYHVLRLGQVNKWTFIVSTLKSNHPFQHKLSFGGHQEVYSFGFDHIQRLQRVAPRVGDGAVHGEVASARTKTRPRFAR